MPECVLLGLWIGAQVHMPDIYYKTCSRPLLRERFQPDDLHSVSLIVLQETLA